MCLLVSAWSLGQWTGFIANPDKKQIVFSLCHSSLLMMFDLKLRRGTLCLLSPCCLAPLNPHLSIDVLWEPMIFLYTLLPRLSRMVNSLARGHLRDISGRKSLLHCCLGLQLSCVGGKDSLQADLQPRAYIMFAL